MARDARQPEGLTPPGPPYSPVVVAEDLVFTAGQVAFDASSRLIAGGIEEQTDQVLDNVERCLAAAGGSMDDVVKVTVFLSDLRDFDAFNRVYARRFVRRTPRGQPSAPSSRTGSWSRSRRWRGRPAVVGSVEEGRDRPHHPVVVVELRDHPPPVERRTGVGDPEHDEVAHLQWNVAGDAAVRVLVVQSGDVGEAVDAPHLFEPSTDEERSRLALVERHVPPAEADDREIMLGPRGQPTPHLDRGRNRASGGAASNGDEAA